MMTIMRMRGAILTIAYYISEDSEADDNGKIVAIREEFSQESDFPCPPIIAGSLDTVILVLNLGISGLLRPHDLSFSSATSF